MTKKDFILSHADLKTSEVVESAAAEGIKLSENYVNVVRSNNRAKSKQEGGDTASDNTAPKKRGKKVRKLPKSGQGKWKKMLSVAKEEADAIKANATRLAFIMPATQTEAEQALNMAGLRLMEALNEHSRAVIRVALESVATNLSGGGAK